MEDNEYIETEEGILCLKCAVEGIAYKVKPDYTCQRCSRFFYEHETIETDVGRICISCMVEDIKERIEMIEEALSRLNKSIFY